MKKIGILAFSAAAKTELMNKFEDIHFVSLISILGDKEYLQGDIAVKDYFDQMFEKNLISKTSQPSTVDIEEGLKKFADYDYIYVITMNQKFSGTYQNASLAIKNLGLEYKTYLIDAESLVSAESVLIDTIINGIDQGKDIDVITKELQEVKNSCSSYLFPGSFKYLKASGRVNAITSIVGTLLNVKIFLGVKNGKVESIGKGKGYGSIIKMLNNTIKKNGYTDAYYVDFLFDEDKKNKIIKELESFNINIKTCGEPDITTTTHVGPDSFGICFYKKEK